jgi:FAD/FMN-containing dehydrogenase/Fe-S oxidoreductase
MIAYSEDRILNTIMPEFIADLQNSIAGEVRSDSVTRVLYSTDASIHQIEPLGVVFPRNSDELVQIVKLCSQYHIPVIPRGSGSSLAGQAIGRGLIVDCSRYLNHLITVIPEENKAVVEPGMILDDFNREIKKYNLIFGPDPASSERATIGGCIGNNAAGAHSIEHGMTADHIVSADIVLADGMTATFKPISIENAQTLAQAGKNASTSEIERKIYDKALHVREQYQSEIESRWPQTWRRVSGYNLNYLIPWSPSYPPQWNQDLFPYPAIIPGTINLCSLLAGSEGTLGLIQNATLRLVPVKKFTILAVINFPTITEACNIVPDILDLAPSAVELIPQSLIHLARSVPAYAYQLSFVAGDPAAILVVEFSGDDQNFVKNQISRLKSLRNWMDNPYIAETKIQQKQVWDVRKVGLGILMSRLGDAKPISFIEDMSVPVERLGEFVSEMDVMLNTYGTQADYYGHASAGCLHIRPLVNIKTSQGRAELRSIAKAAVDIVINLGGAVSAEHGDGITRGEWIEQAYGPKIVQALREIKAAADPNGILNPGKIVDTPKMDSDLRYDETYKPIGWTPVMGFESSQPKAINLIAAIEQCNGAGVCRKSTGVMCPSFQATKDEMFSTRGRANLLRAMVSNKLTTQEIASNAVKETLELCLACKGCKAECPSAVDMAKLKYEFYQHYYSSPGHHHPIRDYVFAYIGHIARFGQLFAPLVNYFLSAPLFEGIREYSIGLSRKRTLPRLSRVSLHRKAKSLVDNTGAYDCIFLSDAFNEYFFPNTGMDAINVLRATGRRIKILSTIGAGRTLISKGFLIQAKNHAKRLIDEIDMIDPNGMMSIIGIEPSEIYTLKDEYPDFFPNDSRVRAISERAFMIDEYLLRPGLKGQRGLSAHIPGNADNSSRTNVLLHGHCYQKAQPPAKDGFPTGVAACVAMLETMGYSVSTIDDGCCGMAGAFGYETEHYSVSMQVGNLALFPAINNHKGQVVAAAGISCQSQIYDGTGILAIHPISLVAQKLVKERSGRAIDK